MSSKRQPGRLDWIETIEVERVDEESQLEQQSVTTGGGSTTPILRKQQTSGSVDHTSDGDSVSEDLAGIAIMETDNTDLPTDAIIGRSASEPSSTESEKRLRQLNPSHTRRNQRWRLLFLCLLASIFLIAIIVGGVCGAGKCPNGREATAAGIEGDTTINNNICDRSMGPLTIGGAPVLGSLSDVTTLSQVPACQGMKASSSFGRWYKVTGGDEVIRISTCNRSTDLVTTVDTVISIFKGDSCANITCVGSNDDFCGTSSSVSLLAEKGINYFIYVTMKNSTAASSANAGFVLTIDYENNGACDSAIGPLLPSMDENPVIGSLRASGSQSVAMACDSKMARGGNVWYTVLGTGEWLRASTCHNVTDFEARLDISSGACDSSQCVAGRDSDCGGYGYQVVWKSQEKASYTLAVFKDNMASGSVFALSIENFVPVENDQCNQPVTVSGDGSVVVGSNLYATLDLAPTCAASSTVQAQPGVWYIVTGTGTTMLASTCHDETDFATDVAVYYASGSCNSLKCVPSAKRQFCQDNKGAIYWDSLKGEEYLIHVFGSDYGMVPNVGTFGLSVSDFVTESNDLCASAISMDVTKNNRVEGSTFSATPDPAVDLCVTNSGSSTPGVWYSTVGTGGLLLASTCSAETTFDTQLSVFEGSCSGQLTCVISDDNTCGLQSSVAWSTKVGVVYFIVVHGSATSAVGDFVLTLETYDPIQENDFCEFSSSVTLDGNLISGSTIQATYDNVGECAGVPNTAPGVWYQLSGTGRQLSASTCNSETAYASAITVLSGNCTIQQCVTASMSTSVNNCSEVTWLSVLDEPYHIVVHGINDSVGNFDLTVQEDNPSVQNEFCVDALPVTLGPDVQMVSTVNATDDEVPTCMNVVQTGPGIWYTVEGTGGRIIASTCSKTDPDFDTRISVFMGGCNNLTCVVGDDNGCGIQSRAVWRSQRDVTYYILIHGPQAGVMGLVVDRFVPALANDFCSAAQGPIIPDGSITFGTTIGSSFDNAGFCGADNTSPGVWFFVLGTGERLTADTCDNRTNFDTKLSIFTGPNCGSLTCVTGNDDGCGLQSSVSWTTVMGKFYFILLSGWGSSVGNYAFRVSGSTIL